MSVFLFSHHQEVPTHPSIMLRSLVGHPLLSGHTDRIFFWCDLRAPWHPQKSTAEPLLSRHEDGETNREEARKVERLTLSHVSQTLTNPWHDAESVILLPESWPLDSSNPCTNTHTNTFSLSLNPSLNLKKSQTSEQPPFTCCEKDAAESKNVTLHLIAVLHTASTAYAWGESCKFARNA